MSAAEKRSAAMTSYLAAVRRGPAGEAEARALRDEAVACASDVLGAPPPGASLFPHLHARRNDSPRPGESLFPERHAQAPEPLPAGLSLLTPAQQAESRARRGSGGVR